MEFQSPCIPPTIYNGLKKKKKGHKPVSLKHYQKFLNALGSLWSCPMTNGSCQFVLIQAITPEEETCACSLLARRCQLLISALQLA